MQTVWLIYKKWDYDEFAAETAYESREDAKGAIVKLQKDDIYDDYDFWLEEIPLVMHQEKD